MLGRNTRLGLLFHPTLLSCSRDFLPCFITEQSMVRPFSFVKLTSRGVRFAEKWSFTLFLHLEKKMTTAMFPILTKQASYGNYLL